MLVNLKYFLALLVVINDDLMGNHQLELAHQLSNDGHLYYCNCRFVTLHSTLIYYWLLFMMT